MKILITGGCGFVGANIALYLKNNIKNSKIYTLDNFSREGSKYNFSILKKHYIKNFNVNILNYKRLKNLQKFDLIIDCCAEASVEVSRKSIDKVINVNFIGTLNILKKSINDNSKLIFISTSRVYSIKEINNLVPDFNFKKPIKIKKKINEKFFTKGPKTIYGFSKLASEMLIDEFSYAFNHKYLINRCGVISGPMQFGKLDQGFISHWLWSHINKKKLSYIGYGGYGNQVRDVLHIYDLCDLILLQIKNFNKVSNEIFTVGGSIKNKISLIDLTRICEKLTGNKINFTKKKKTSIYDIPYYISDNKKVSQKYFWKPKRNINKIVLDTYNWLVNNKFKLTKYFS